jgi:hypothetical protein
MVPYAGWDVLAAIATLLVGIPLVLYPILRWAVKSELGQFESRFFEQIMKNFVQKEWAEENIHARDRRFDQIDKRIDGIEVRVETLERNC